MKKVLRYFVFGIFFLLSGAMGSTAFTEEGLTGDAYTKVNIWYEKPTKILSTNYHKGTMLPAGTEVEILKHTGKTIEFRDKLTGTVYKIKKVKNFTRVDQQGLYDRYFSKDNPMSGKYNSFSAEEKKAIKEGRVEKGMSRDAVLMAYGYPPTHRTPFLEQETWTYWDSRLISFMVLFRDDRVVSRGRDRATDAEKAA